MIAHTRILIVHSAGFLLKPAEQTQVQDFEFPFSFQFDILWSNYTVDGTVRKTKLGLIQMLKKHHSPGRGYLQISTGDGPKESHELQTYRGNQLHLLWWHFLGAFCCRFKHRKTALEEANASAVSWLFQSVGMVEFSQNEKYSSSETNSENVWKLMLPKKTFLLGGHNLATAMWVVGSVQKLFKLGHKIC